MAAETTYVSVGMADDADSNDVLAQQDIAVIRRNVQSVERVTSGRAQRYYQGLDQGLSNCSD